MPVLEAASNFLIRLSAFLVLVYVARIWNFPSNPHDSSKLFNPLFLGHSIMGFVFRWVWSWRWLFYYLSYGWNLELLLGKQSIKELPLFLKFLCFFFPFFFSFLLFFLPSFLPLFLPPLFSSFFPFYLYSYLSIYLFIY